MSSTIKYYNYAIRVIIDEIINAATTESAIRMGSIPIVGGENQAYEHSITDLDKNILVFKLQQGASAVYEAMNAYFRRHGRFIDDEDPTNDTPDRYAPSFQYNTLDTAINKNIIRYDIMVPENFDINLIETILNNIIEALTSYLLSVWYEMKGMGPEAQSKSAQFYAGLKNIKSVLDRRTTRIKRPYRAF